MSGTISVSLPADGTTADVSDYNTPITTIVNAINGGLDNSNIVAAAGIAGSKLADKSVAVSKLIYDYCFSCYLTNNFSPGSVGDKQLFSTSGGSTTENYDYNNNLDANGVYTAPVAGVYRFAGVARQTGSITLTVAWYKNGSLYAYGGAGTTQRMAGTIDVLLAAGDTFSMWINVSAGAAISSGQANTYYGGSLIRAT